VAVAVSHCASTLDELVISAAPDRALWGTMRTLRAPDAMN
jgi:hypothetical protein